MKYRNDKNYKKSDDIYLNLISKPGSVMATGWWDKLNITSWKPLYSANPENAYLINKIIKKKLPYDFRYFPAKTHGLFDFLNKFSVEVACVILFLSREGKADYFIKKEYRDVLLEVMDNTTLNNFPIITPATSNMNVIPANDLIKTAVNYGKALFSLSIHPGVRILELLWEPDESSCSHEYSVECVDLIDINNAFRWF